MGICKSYHRDKNFPPGLNTVTFETLIVLLIDYAGQRLIQDNLSYWYQHGRKPVSALCDDPTPHVLHRFMLFREIITVSEFSKLFTLTRFNHITAPVCHGTNSTSPKPSSSLLLRFPDAILIISSKISSPFS